MQLQPKGNIDPRQRFHAPTNVTKDLLDTGLYEVVPGSEPKPKPFQAIQWRTGFSAEVDGQPNYLYAPHIHAKCPMCGNPNRGESQGGTAHVTFRYSHTVGCEGSKVDQPVPPAIAKEYQKLFAKWLQMRDPAARKAAEKERRANSAVALFKR